MKRLFSHVKLSLIAAVVLLFLSSAPNAFSQKLSKIDQLIQPGLDALKARKWSEAIKSFEDAQKVLDKEKQPSAILFTLIKIPDEDNTVAPEERAKDEILGFRHAMATRQALVQFLSFAHQLNGNSVEAQKYHDAVYSLQNAFWGASWRIFMPLFYRAFDEQVKGEKGENFGRYQYLAALLLLDSGSPMTEVFEILQTARQNSPKDAEIAGLLANGFLQKRNPQEARKLAEFSLSVKPADARVLIDLATAEWLLGDFDNSIRHADAAAKLDAELPGPRLTLAMNYIEKKDFPRALKEAVAAVELSRRHPFYLTVQAAALEASGSEKEAEKLLREAWQKKLPTFEDLDTWYINQTLRELILKIAKRLDKPKSDA